MEHLPDKELLSWTDGQAAFRVLYDRYWQPLYQKALVRLGSNTDAEDAVQEVFISCWRNRHTIQTDGSLAPYLFTALKYCIIKMVDRAARKGIVLSLSVIELEHTELSTEELLLNKELQTLIAREVAQLPEQMRRIYQLSRTEALSVAEIADRLNLSEQTVKNTLSTALKKLRQRLSGSAFLLLLL